MEEYRYISLVYQLTYLEDEDDSLSEFKYFPLSGFELEEHLGGLLTFDWDGNFEIDFDEHNSYSSDASHDSVSEIGSTDNADSSLRPKLDSSSKDASFSNTTLDIPPCCSYLRCWFPSVQYVFGLSEASRSREAGSIYTDFSWRLPMTAPTKSSDLIVSTLQPILMTRKHQKHLYIQDVYWHDDLDVHDTTIQPEIEEIREPIHELCRHQSRYQSRRLSFRRCRAFGSIYNEFSSLVVKIPCGHLPLILRQSVFSSDYGEWEGPSEWCLRCSPKRY